MKRLTLFSLMATLAMLFAACAPAATPTAAPTAAPATQAPTAVPTSAPTATAEPQTLTVFAAASLTGAFGDIGKAFEAANPNVTVKFNFAGSQSLRTQIEQGAAVDVFASADHKNMDPLTSENLVASGADQDFATNLLTVILPPSNPANLQTLQDLAKPGLKLVLADASVPVGNYSRQVLSNLSKDPTYGTDFSTKVLANVVSNETDVKQVVAKVDQGEGDAGIVYVTDALAAPDLKFISIPADYNVIARYPIAALEKAPNPDLAKAFVAYVLSADGQAVLKKWGFSPVTP
ncbi:MAG TPA: molybdate ABC transporter substrate-binding protein [Anaerolineales bacterium]|nr:molybdate ABC transporter substrate-binding protein [Anaerolineales bacterium]